MTNMGVVLLLFLLKAALATPSLYVVTLSRSLLVLPVCGETVFYDHDLDSTLGIYEEKREPELHYKKVGEPDSSGNYRFLYTDSRHPQTWILGKGRTFSTAAAAIAADNKNKFQAAAYYKNKLQAVYRAPAKTGRQALTQWSEVHDFSREGEEWSGVGGPNLEWLGECQKSVPSLRVAGVETNLTAEEVKKQIEGEDAFVTEEYIICKTPRDIMFQSRHFRYDNDWLILDRNGCILCNKIEDCDNGFDERDCPPFVYPSFELPVICCLVVLLLGILLHLGWKAVTKTAEDEAREMENIGATGRQLEEAVDAIVQAVIEDQPFPEDSFKILHNHCGGIDFLIGDRYGKSIYL